MITRSVVLVAAIEETGTSEKVEVEVVSVRSYGKPE
jgi:hypothetical protein